MAWSSLADYVLADKLREKEIEVEVESEHEKWRRQVFKEIDVFVRRVKGLNLDEADDREKFYDVVSSMESRTDELRERSESSSAPTDALIEMEKLNELLDDTSAPLAFGRSYIDPTPAQQREMKRRREERKQSRIETARNQRDEIADKIQRFMDALED